LINFTQSEIVALFIYYFILYELVKAPCRVSRRANSTTIEPYRNNKKLSIYGGRCERRCLGTTEKRFRAGPTNITMIEEERFP
jgi:hypothetical protein